MKQRNRHPCFLAVLPPLWVQKTELRQHQRGRVKKSEQWTHALPAPAGYLVSVNLIHGKRAAVRTVITVNRTHLESSSIDEPGRKMSWKNPLPFGSWGSFFGWQWFLRRIASDWEAARRMNLSPALQCVSMVNKINYLPIPAMCSSPKYLSW